jgi:REP element-mobilizing transposase RayT
VEKEQFVRILHRVSQLYTIRVVAYQVMSNHVHLLLLAPQDPPTTEEVCRRFRNFHGGKRTLDPDSEACRQWQQRCRDVSWFMRHLQQLFTMWYNRTRPVRRRGKLWADRFKNTLLEAGLPVWRCWLYIENNPVRAGMVQRAADYRFGSLGRWYQSGAHPFASHVRQDLLPALAPIMGTIPMETLLQRMLQVLAEKTGHATADVDEPEASPIRMLHRRVRYWTDGLVIGSEIFVRNLMADRHPNPDRHRLADLSPQHLGARVTSWRRLRATG